MEFRTVLQNQDIELNYFHLWLNLPKETDIETTCVATIKWSSDIEYREDRIKSITATVHNIDLQVEYSYQQDPEDESKGYVKEFNYILSDINFEINDDDFKVIDGQLSIINLEADCKTKTFKVN